MKDKKKFFEDEETINKNRRNFPGNSGTVTGGIAADSVSGTSTDNTAECITQNPYEPRPGGGIRLPEYF
jgi:hypothetical protein